MLFYKPKWKEDRALEFQDIFNWMLSVGVQYGYFGVFVISLLGAVSILLPIPDSLTVFTISGLKVGGSWVFEPVWVAVAAGVGSAIGEFSGYLLGFGGRKAITGRYRKNVDFLVKVFNKFGAVAIFIFALTPLPDDMIFIPLGVMRYNPIKALLPAFAGKFIFNLIVAYGGRFSIDFIEDTFGVGGDFTTALIIFAAGIALTIIMFRFDWGKYFEKYLFKPANSR
jgi:membrane protein YqaA with SNARE-associated domain